MVSSDLYSFEWNMFSRFFVCLLICCWKWGIWKKHHLSLFANCCGSPSIISGLLSLDISLKWRHKIYWDLFWTLILSGPICALLLLYHYWFPIYISAFKCVHIPKSLTLASSQGLKCFLWSLGSLSLAAQSSLGLWYPCSFYVLWHLLLPSTDSISLRNNQYYSLSAFQVRWNRNQYFRHLTDSPEFSTSQLLAQQKELVIEPLSTDHSTPHWGDGGLKSIKTPQNFLPFWIHLFDYLLDCYKYS